MPDLTIFRHEHPDEDLELAPKLAELVCERFDTVPQIGDRILDKPKGVGATEWRVYDRGFYPRTEGGEMTITLCPCGRDPDYFRRTTNKHLQEDA